jgi:hypothetical protein
VFVAPLLVLLALAAVLILTVVVAIRVGWTNGQVRQRRRAAEAARFGWVPVPPNPWLMEVAAARFLRGEADVMFAGDFRGRALCVLDYRYSTGSGNGRARETVHLVALNLPVALPPLTLTRHSTLGRFFLGRGQELENNAFNDTFRIDCPDDRFASDVLHPRMMEWMLFNPGLEWQFAGNALVSWGHGAFEIGTVTARLEAMHGLIDRIPPYVLRDYGRPS